MVDGGLTANIPNDIAKNLGADLTIVVNSTSNLRSIKELQDPLNTADQILSITMAQLNELQLKGASVIITPDIKNYSALNYQDINYLITKGENKTAELMSSIKNKIDSLELSESRYMNNFITNPKVEITSDIQDRRLSDTLNELSDNYFERYTSIEKNLKMIYNTGEYKDVYAVVSRSGFSASINYNLIANPVLKKIEIENSVYLLDSMLASFEKYYTGKNVNSFEYHHFFDELLGKLRINSYSLIEIEKFHYNYSSNTLEIKFSKGDIRGIELVGNKVTNDNVILREVTIDQSSTVKKKNVDESIKNVMSTNLFRQLSFDYDFSKNLYAPYLKINMVEKNSKALRFSLKADNVRNLQLLFDLRDENIFGTAIETGILAAGGLRNRIYQFDIKSNQFFSLPLTFNYNLFYKFTDIYRYAQVIDTNSNEFDVIKIGEYRDEKYGMSFLLGAQVKRFGTIYGQIFFENLGILNKFDSQNLTEDLRVIKLKFGAVFDTEDRVPFPTKGTLINFYYETANNTIQSNTSFTKLYFSYDQYFTVAKSQILRPRFIFGFGDKTTPLSEQFYLGGQNSFFGMVEDELTGRQIVEASFEYRYLFPYKIFFDTYFSIRYDLGNVWQVSEDIRFRDLRHGLGMSLEFDTPIGEASFSVGRSFIVKKGLTEDSFIFGPYDFYYSIGYDI
jgi:NTE family protein